MNLELYQMTPLEEWITARYQRHGFLAPEELHLEEIAALFGGEIAFTRLPSHVRWCEKSGDFLIFLHQHLSEVERRSEFFHELCHPLRHSGNQLSLPPALRDLQEMQAGHFQLYAAMPFYLLQTLPMPKYERDWLHQLALAFRVPISLACRRWEQIKRRIWLAQEHEWSMMIYQQKQRSALKKPSLTPETKRLLSQLQKQLSRECE
ncbi:ImmA/IrrE family metallo-endopeptidase [Brevibacillus laterosporus]|uniref:ImmA/IrrE family metallo-endopeptidase n=1 Tax=Brevibacillus laterosporus TaxID=1465 RepID=UPI0026553091|nr:ImmA/IrrE family metallo-endopeptidase [Brevibacillus laterosporus]MDN9010361.1 ImmA/IrrE family metallo-endopeptidase [Brevibacillus laterosporus]MDO0941248.1 ImmA/IrrE family metallo-endopeptidase [Brevibacillus laterosporus]